MQNDNNAPSTDEGEARMPVRRCAVCEGEITASSGEWWIPEQILHVEGGEPHRAVYVRDWQAAAIRAPLEERIRDMLRAFDYWNATRGRDDESDERTFRAFLSTLAPLRALATPPSSTEGTKEGGE